MGSPWTDEELGILELGLINDLSYSAISEKLREAGFERSKNSCISRAKRLDLAKLPIRNNSRKVGRHLKVKKKSSRHSKSSGSKNELQNDIDLNDPIDCDAVALEDLEPHHCRWPIGDPQSSNFRFCGKRRRLGASYCQEHWERSCARH